MYRLAFITVYGFGQSEDYYRQLYSAAADGTIGDLPHAALQARV